MSSVSTDRTLSFGAFRLVPAQGLLLRADEPVRVGSRSLAILVALAERAGEVVSKSELFEAVWPNIAVEESSLRVHVSALRKALGEGQSGARYVVTVPGRGYRFAMQVDGSKLPARSSDDSSGPVVRGSLPISLTRMFGRGEFVESLVSLLQDRRLVTVVGPGGMGKTLVAIAVAAKVAPGYADGAHLVELARLTDPRLVPTALASALGKPVTSRHTLPGLLEFLQNKQMLVVLDNCEHLIDAAADLAEQVIKAAPQVTLLATSREPLRAMGESLARLPPLGLPPQSTNPSAAEALAFPAVQLFLERAKATRDDFALDDQAAPMVAEICRRLDGIPLAIELAAGRVDAFGVRELASLLDERFRVLTNGRRTALPRQQTLRATFDWSVDLLSDGERAVLRRFSVFVGAVSLEAALAVVIGSDQSASEAADNMAGLVSKSLLSADTSDIVAQYRLLESTRSYAREMLAESGESGEAARRHAAYYAGHLEQAREESLTKPLAEWMAEYGHSIDNVHVAIDWALSVGGDRDVGVALTAASVPLWMRLTLLEECRTRVEHALAILSPDVDRGGRREMQLFAAFAAAFTHTKGPGPEAESAWLATLQIAERLEDVDFQLRALWGLWISRHTADHQGKALEAARQFGLVAARSSDAADPIVGDRMIGTTLWARGELEAARKTLERMLRLYSPPADLSHLPRFQFDQRVAGRSALALTLWLQGYSEEAIQTASASARIAQDLAHDPSIFHATALSGCRVALLAGDTVAANKFLALLQGAVARQVSYGVWIRAYTGEMFIREGNAELGSQLLGAALVELPKPAFHTHYPVLRAALAQGLAATGQESGALALIEDCLALAEKNEERWFVPELLRIRGEMLSAGRTVGATEEDFRLSLAMARRQGALAWELRTAMSLARLWSEQGNAPKALGLLAEVHAKFTEGFGTPDLINAAALLNQLRSSDRRGRRDVDKIEANERTGL